MTRPEGLEKLGVVFASLVRVGDQQGNRGAGGDALIDAREDLNLIALLALRDEATGSRTASIQVGLDIFLAQGQSRGTAINDTTNGFAVGLTKIGDRE